MKISVIVRFLAVSALIVSLDGCLLALAGGGIRYSTVTHPAAQSYSSSKNTAVVYTNLVETLEKSGTIVDSDPKVGRVSGVDTKHLYKYTCVVHRDEKAPRTLLDIKVELIGNWDTPDVGTTTTSTKGRMLIATLGSKLGDTPVLLSDN